MCVTGAARHLTASSFKERDWRSLPLDGSIPRMARIRQSGGASGVRKAPRSLWERAGARAGNGAGALFARLDAQDAQDAQRAATPDAHQAQAREQGARTLERLAAAMRAGAWNAELAALVARAESALQSLPDAPPDMERSSGEKRG